jgi:hypothetical protein
MKEQPSDIVVDASSEELGEASSLNSDDALLASMGKTPELKRIYNYGHVSSKHHLLKKSNSTSTLLIVVTDLVPNHDLMQLVVPRCPLLHHLRH